MAKTKGPLFSLEAHGSLSKILNYSQRRSGSQCRKYNKPLKPPTPAQRALRRLTEFLVAQWQNMSAGDKATWAANALASKYNLSGYHYFLREAQRDLYLHHGLVGYWHCNEIVGGKVLDLSGNSNHGTLQPSYPSNAPTLVNSRSLRFSKALSCDGIDEWINCGDKPSLDIGINDFSILGWIKVGKRVDILARPIVAGSDEYFLMLFLNGILFCRITQGGTGRQFQGTADLRSNTWRAFAAVFDRDANGQAYTDGAADGSPVDISAAAGKLAPTQVLGIGKHYGVAFLEGLIDEVCIYNRALSAAEIATRYKFAIAKV